MLFAFYPKTSVTEQNYAAYELGLADVPLPRLRELVVRCAKKYRALPSVAEILAEHEGVADTKFLPAPLKTAAELDEQRQGRPRLDLPHFYDFEQLPDPFPKGYQLMRESREERLERLRRTQDWGSRYE
jgi:hypothetical protein